MLYPSVAMRQFSSRHILDGDPHTSGWCPVRQRRWPLFRSTCDWTTAWQYPVRQVAGNDNDIIMKCALLPGHPVFIVVIALTDPVNRRCLEVRMQAISVCSSFNFLTGVNHVIYAYRRNGQL